MKTIADHILDIVQNSTRAGANLIEIIVVEDRKRNLYVVEIQDNGAGMSPEVLKQATNPFFTSRKTRKVGLGLSLLKQNAEQAGGGLQLFSAPGKGTTVQATFQFDHLDRPAPGDLAEVFLLAAIGHDKVRFCYRHTTGSGSFSIDTAELAETLGEVSLAVGEVRRAVAELIQNNLEAIGATR
ncbi:MAG TPA: ATP-binding protein [Prolixibacteraceae bacterium]|nr:ATP-binding protein [Prolixibacteraceae bacterium]